MDKLSKNIRRPGGDLVAPKRPHGRRLLLPTEVELCKLLNLSEDEYWYFLDTTAAYNGTRPEGYELIPDIRADALSFLVTKQVLVQLGIAVAAATISYLLTPKPKEQKQGGSRRTADAIGNSKFAPQASFNSVQELANIGDAIPLIFANQTTQGGYVYGGIRVNSQLLWSQFVSLGKYQQLKALALFSHGTLAEKPAYQGFAVGDTLLNTYNAHKVGLYFKDGSNSNNNRIVENNVDKYSESELAFTGSGDDPFAVGLPNRVSDSIPKLTSRSFSGARNPTTQTAFGVYSPLPNCQICRLPYELIRDPRGSSKESIKDMMRKRKKVEFALWPTRAGILKINNTTTKGLYSVNKNDTIEYQIVGRNSGDGNAYQRKYNHEDRNADAFNYRPHGVTDVDNLSIQIRENADAIIEVGEQYLFGTALVICISNNNSPQPYSIEETKSYTFKVVESGEVDLPVNGGNLTTHCQNPEWYDPNVLGFRGGSSDTDPLYSLSDLGPIFWQQIISDTEFNYGRGTNDLYYAHDIYTAQRVSLATVSNNRKCHVTEIGIKSTVYKKIRFANVNSQPDEEALKRAFEDRTQIQLGQVDTYATRFSLFMLQARRIGSSNWQNLINGTIGNHSGLFVVQGRTPEAQYNAITISHPSLDQYEYRFKPYPGNWITRKQVWNKAFNLLTTNGQGNGQISHFSAGTSFGTFVVAFSGKEDYRITTENSSNNEWQLGESSSSTSGTVTGANLNGRTSWTEESSIFNGTYGDCIWDTNRVITNETYVIVLWNEISAPEWSAGERSKGRPGYHWQLYDGVRNDWVTSFFPNDKDQWSVPWFWQSTPERRYVVANPAVYGKPSSGGSGSVGHKFYVIEQTWQCKTEYRTKYEHFNGVVSVTEGSGTGLKVNLTVQKVNRNEGNPSFSVSYIYKVSWSLDNNNLGTGYVNGDQVKIPWSDHNGSTRETTVTLTVSNRKIITRAAQNFNPYDALVDWNVYEGDENSNRNNPEHEIVYVNEITKPATDNSGVEQFAKYSDLAFSGIRINSSKEWTNFSQLSAYFKKGIKIEQLNSSGTGASNLFPEIAYALLTNSAIGAGRLVGASSVDRSAMANAAAFCSKNRFFWDGTISSKLNLRDFIFEHAGYCLLDFTIIGGKFSLKPSVPVDSSNRINKTILPEIKCLFTDGNINDLQVSFLSPEERQTFRAAVLYRSEEVNGFPETKSILVEENIANSATDPIETFDLSGFCTSRVQALYFAFFAIRSRRLIDHGLTFKTAPQYVQGLGPGDYFRLVSEVSHTSRFRNGAKLEDGTIVSKDDVAGSENVLYWEPGTVGVKSSTLSQAPNGVLFTVKNTTTENKVYKCESISYGEDGLIEVAGSYAPTEPNGELSVMQYWGLNGDITNFTITSEQ